MYIDYVTVTFKSTELDELIKSLEKRGLTDLADLVDQSGADWYGELRHSWNPFGQKTIKEMMDDFSDNPLCPPEFVSLEDDFETVVENPKVFEPIEHAKVFFIDLLTIYSPNGLTQFREAHDSLLGQIPSRYKCCFIINHSLPHKIREQIELDLKENGCWNNVRIAYKKGALHKMVRSDEDFHNFVNYIIKGVSSSNCSDTNAYVRYPDGDGPKSLPKI